MTGEIQAAFDIVYEDGPIGSPTMPEKSRIRAEIGGLLESKVTGLETELSALSDTVGEIGTGSAEGLILEATKANLDARAVSLGLGAGDAGRGGRVYQDSTAANNGDYRWTGSAWSYLGADRLGKVEAATGAPVFALNRPMTWDRDGALHNGPALGFYVPRSFNASIGSTTVNGTFGTPSAALPDYVMVTVAGAGEATVYIDLDDTTNPVKITNYPATPSKLKPDKIIKLATIRSYRVVWSIAPVLEPSIMDIDRVLPRYPLVVEKDKVLIPTLFHVNRGDGVYQLYSPADGSRYWEFDRQTSSATEDRIVFDRTTAGAGLPPVRLLAGSAQPRIPGGAFIVEIASMMARELHTKHAMHGYCAGGLVPNQFVMGDAPDQAHLFAPGAGTTLVDITDPDLLTLGFTRGVSGDSAFYGYSLPEDTPLQGYLFSRLYVQVPTDNVWGTPRVYILGKTGVLAGVDLVMEKKLSARAAIFLLFTQYSFTERPSLVFLGQYQTGTGRIATGGQCYVGPGERGWIARDDRPIKRRADVLYGATHYSISGREVPFFPSSALAERDEDGGAALTVSKTSSNTLPYIEEQRGAFKLDYSKAGSAIKMTAAGRHSLSGTRFDRTVAISRKTGPIVKSPKILAIGDSITLFGMVPIIDAKLADIGLSPSWVGTLKMLIDRPSTYSTLFAEGRSGWALGDDTYSKTAQPAVPVGDEGVYLARSSEGTYGTTRHQYNPFIRDATGADSVDIIRNGKVFDPRFYFDRFNGLVPGFNATDPDFVLIGLLTNDINEENAATALQRATSDLRLVLTQTRAAFPAAKIGWWLPAPPRSPVSDVKWREWYVPCIRAALQVIASLGDPNIEAVSTWAHMSVQSGYPFGTSETSGGQTFGWIADDLHPSSLNQQLIGEVLAQYIACRA